MKLEKQNIIFQAVKVEDELPPFPQIVVVLIDGRLTMMAQIRPSENGHEWWTLGMGEAKRIEENKKCVTHWLKPLKQVYVLTEDELYDILNAKEIKVSLTKNNQ